MVRLRKAAKEMQMLPEAAAKALEILEEPECSIRDFAHIINKDVTLVSSLLSVANSPFYGRGRPVGSVHEAVVQVGFRQCHNLIHACCAQSLMDKLSEDQPPANRLLVVHSQVVAMIAVDLSNMLGLKLGGVEYTVGILHDVGRLLLFNLIPDEYVDVDPVDFCEENWNENQEISKIETDHCRVGCMLAIANKLPDAVCEAIRYHHTPESAVISPQLTALTAAADDFANYAMRNDLDTPYDASKNTGLSILLNHRCVVADATPEDYAAVLMPRVLEATSKMDISK